MKSLSELHLSSPPTSLSPVMLLKYFISDSWSFHGTVQMESEVPVVEAKSHGGPMEGACLHLSVVHELSIYPLRPVHPIVTGPTDVQHSALFLPDSDSSPAIFKIAFTHVTSRILLFQCCQYSNQLSNAFTLSECCINGTEIE